MKRELVLRCNARFVPDGISGTEWSCYSDEQKREYADWCPVTVPWDSVEYINESSEGYTTLCFKSGSTLTVDIMYEVADILIENYKAQGLG